MATKHDERWSEGSWHDDGRWWSHTATSNDHAFDWYQCIHIRWIQHTHILLFAQSIWTHIDTRWVHIIRVLTTTLFINYLYIIHHEAKSDDGSIDWTVTVRYTKSNNGTISEGYVQRLPYNFWSGVADGLVAHHSYIWPQLMLTLNEPDSAAPLINRRYNGSGASLSAGSIIVIGTYDI